MSVEISPATTTRPVVISVSQATRPSGSSARTASRTESEIWSATLSGCPSVTDSEVNRNSRAAMTGHRLPGAATGCAGRRRRKQLPDRQPGCEPADRTGTRAERDERSELVELQGGGRLGLAVPRQRRECLQDRSEPLEVCVCQPCDLGGNIGGSQPILEGLVVDEGCAAGVEAGRRVGEQARAAAAPAV